jgi:hypothetical protein
MNPEKRPRRKFCSLCNIHLVRLDDFDGTSSRDAPGFEARGSVDNWALLWLSLPWKAVAALWKHKSKRKRVQEVARLRDEVLPSDPTARICPHCLGLVLSDEL